MSEEFQPSPHPLDSAGCCEFWDRNPAAKIVFVGITAGFITRNHDCDRPILNRPPVSSISSNNQHIWPVQLQYCYLNTWRCKILRWIDGSGQRSSATEWRHYGNWWCIGARPVFSNSAQYFTGCFGEVESKFCTHRYTIYTGMISGTDNERIPSYTSVRIVSLAKRADKYLRS